MAEEVKARLEIESQGETEVFGQLAEDLASLPEKAEAADAPLSGLGTTLRELAETEGLAGIAQHLDAVGKALQDFDGADSIDQQRQALVRLEAAWEGFGNQTVNVVKDTDQALDDYKAGLEAIRQAQAGLADPLTASMEQAQQAVAALEDTTQNSFQDSEAAIERAGIAVKRYSTEVEAARQNGQGLAKEQAEELTRLGEAYEEARTKVEAFRSSQDSARKDMDRTRKASAEVRKGFSSLEGALDALGGKFGATALKGLAIKEAFETGFAAGEQLRKSINSLTDGALDRFIQKGLGVEALMERWVGVQTAAADEADQLRLATLKLAQEGIDTANLSGQEILETYEKLRQEWVEDTAEVLRLDAAYRKFIETQDLSRESLDEQAKTLVGVIERFREANQQLSEGDIQGIFAEQIQSLLDSYARLSVGAEESFRRQADGWKITTTAAEQAAERQRQLIAALREDLGAQAEDTTLKIKTLLEAIPEALEGIDLKELEIISPERFEKAKQLIEGLVAAAREAGQQIPKELAEAAGQVGVLVGQIEIAGEAFTFFAGGADTAGDSALEVKRKVDETGRSIVEITQNVDRSGTAFGDYGEAIDQTQRPLESMDELMARVEATAADLADGTEQSAERTSQAGDRFKEASDKVQEGAEALEKEASAADSAGASIDGATTATEGLASAQDSATSSLQAAATEIETLETRLADLQSQVTTTAQAIRDGFAQAQGFSDPILAELDLIIAKAQETASALQAVQNGGIA